ncbi:16S rRNA (cytosine(1402)-N(4))-methyltransferase [Candidatus Peregrinibacteria bacterium]|nr:MAG: 16S rRNA (cytosine(1402)-N(4))-methyltransferase [Candidatus Peregrinibacteria bacterium]
MHIPVLLHQSVDGLNISQGMTIIDGTMGLGGHTKCILEKVGATGKVIAIDQDKKNIAIAETVLKKYEQSLKIVHDNFANIKEILEKNNIKSVNGILLDIGIASTHVDQEDRGFSYTSQGPLDMRMNNEQDIQASDILNTYSQRDIAKILSEYGEEKASWKISKAICEQREIKKFETTFDLTELLESVIKQKHKNKYAQTFQALRIAVNNELDVLSRALEGIMPFLAPGGRIVVISYHSLEDRIVKRFFRKQAEDCICPEQIPRCICSYRSQLKIITKKPITPPDDELTTNPRSRSGKLRIAERTDAPLINREQELIKITS